MLGETVVIVGEGLFGGVLLPTVHNKAEPLAITELLTDYMVPIVGETCTPTVA